MPLQSFVDGGAPVIGATWLNAIDAFYFTLFNSATTAAAARTALSVPATADVLALTGGTLTGAINDTLETVASHATTADIWSAGNVIDWTGTATTTAFPAAPIAGARRRLVCAGACLFTSGASLIILGLPSGSTVTMKQYAVVDVLALSTTVFQLEYALGGSFTATATGMTAGITATWNYAVRNGVATIYAATLSGTSNTTAFTVTGFPAELCPTTNARLFYGTVGTDNSATYFNGYGSLSTAGTLTLAPSWTAGANGWTGSGGKSLSVTNYTYLLGV